MSESLTERCRTFSKQVHPYPDPKQYYFPAIDDKPMTAGNFYKNFRRFLWQARISHGGVGHGPRIQDFRHVYAVHCLKKWVLEGKDLSVCLPVLKTYMGHSSFEETAYYLHLTVEEFPDILLKIETCYPEIIPVLGGDNEAY